MSKFKIVKLGQMRRDRAPDKVESTPVHGYISYRDLLVQGRAIRNYKTFVLYATAGVNPKQHRLTCQSAKDAKRIGSVMLASLRKARSDDEYNARIATFLEEVRDAWPDRERQTVHVHRCNQEVPGRVAVSGKCDCGFDWAKHTLDEECRCHPDIDGASDLSAAGIRFVKHKPITRTEVIINE